MNIAHSLEMAARLRRAAADMDDSLVKESLLGLAGEYEEQGCCANVEYDAGPAATLKSS